MIKLITKRSGTVEEFKLDKVVQAIIKAGKETGEVDAPAAKVVANAVYDNLIESPHVEEVQDEVEKQLMKYEFFKTAKAYILYREKRNKERKPDLFKPRLGLKPREYPHLYEYTDAIRQSYWIHTEYNFVSDVQDFKVHVNDSERNAIKNAMLAISQVEVDVKTFWGNLFSRMPKPELAAVGYTFAESEVRHSDAYSHLLEILGLNSEFDKVHEIPALMQRVDYLKTANLLAKTGEDEDFVLSVLLFSLFIEHISLFSQFLVMLSFNKYKNLFKGVANVIQSTSKEEELHGLFGIDLINQVREERPEWFNADLESKVYEAAKEAMRSEEIVIDWIYEMGDLEFMPKYNTKEYVKNRLNNSLESIGFEHIFDVDEDALEITEFLDDEIRTTMHTDFFVKRSINYSKRGKSITSDDLF